MGTRLVEARCSNEAGVRPRDAVARTDSMTSEHIGRRPLTMRPPLATRVLNAIG